MILVPGFREKSKNNVRVAAVCVYPKFVKTVQDFLEGRGLNMTGENFFILVLKVVNISFVSVLLICYPVLPFKPFDSNVMKRNKFSLK